jgi:hypothetical protein
VLRERSKEAPAPLTVADRCDSCPAAAQVRVTLASGNELVFCQHHYAKNAAALETLATEIYQNPEPESGA